MYHFIAMVFWGIMRLPLNADYWSEKKLYLDMTLQMNFE